MPGLDPWVGAWMTWTPNPPLTSITSALAPAPLFSKSLTHRPWGSLCLERRFQSCGLVPENWGCSMRALMQSAEWTLSSPSSSVMACPSRSSSSSWARLFMG